ncbi:hypothetical protein QFZ81_006717 [Paenibacillus sp. V4I9]|nr:hypothetical protein [Paenibacillus sp. V4I9]
MAYLRLVSYGFYRLRYWISEFHLGSFILFLRISLFQANGPSCKEYNNFVDFCSFSCRSCIFYNIQDRTLISAIIPKGRHNPYIIDSNTRWRKHIVGKLY